jgi:hypothetical protein
MQVPNFCDYPFSFCWHIWKFNHGRWCCYTFESSSCTRIRGRTWKNTTWCECLPTVVWRRVVRQRIIRKSGAHLSRSFEGVVCTRVDRSAWDCQLFPNLHVLAIYLEFVPTRGVVLERFEECQCEDDNVHLHYRTWVLDDGRYRWLWGPINPHSMEHQAKYLTHTICHILDFLQLWFIPSKSFTKL